MIISHLETTLTNNCSKTPIEGLHQGRAQDSSQIPNGSKYYLMSKKRKKRKKRKKKTWLIDYFSDSTEICLDKWIY
jgi:hypothetical protein